MKLSPCARIVAPPALLPAFDPKWKDKCRSCLHCSTLESAQHGGQVTVIMRCAMHPGRDSSCSDMRLPDRKCGPKARLWEAKT